MSTTQHTSTVEILGVEFKLVTTETVDEKAVKYSTEVFAATKDNADEPMGTYSQHVSAPLDFDNYAYLPVPEDVKSKVRTYVEMAAIQNALSRYCATQLAHWK